MCSQDVRPFAQACSRYHAGRLTVVLSDPCLHVQVGRLVPGEIHESSSATLTRA